MRFIWLFSTVSVPILVIFVIAYGVIRGVKVYDAFCKGAKDGLLLVIKILPYICATVVSVGLLRDSGLLDIFCGALSEPLSSFGIPSEIVSLYIIRPFSSSAALGLLSDIFNTCSVNSFVADVASTMMGSTETTFYTISLYYGAVGVKKTRYTVAVAMICDAVAMISAVLFCKLLLS